MKMHWTPEERRLLRSLKSPEKIQDYLNKLIYNPTDHASSPRWVMITKEAHCFEGGLLAACALELQGHKPLMVDLIAQNDDHHVLTVYKASTGWGSISKSNLALLSGRRPYFASIRELVMSYFPFYFNIEGQPSLYGYSNPINLNNFKSWDWRTTDADLMEMGMSFAEYPHFEIISPRQITKLSKVEKRVFDACLLGADLSGVYRP